MGGGRPELVAGALGCRFRHGCARRSRAGDSDTGDRAGTHGPSDIYCPSVYDNRGFRLWSLAYGARRAAVGIGASTEGAAMKRNFMMQDEQNTTNSSFEFGRRLSILNDHGADYV